MIHSFNNPLILRHLEDVQDFRVEDRDTPILTKELKKVPTIVTSIANELRGSKVKIHFISSPQLRAQHTLKSVVKGLSKLLPNTLVTFETDTRIRDLYHGKYVVPSDYVPGEKLPAVSLANNIYNQQTFEKKNLDYHNGDSLKGKYPELEGLFDQVGETQRSFSSRFYEFVYDFLVQINDNPDTLYVIVTHTAIVFRLFELVALFNQQDSQNQWQVEPGQLTFYEWDSMRYLEHSPDKLFVYPGDVKHINLEILFKYRQKFSLEIDHLSFKK